MASAPERVGAGCDRWPPGLRLRGVGPDGVTLAKGRCRATNLCPYCQTLYVVETVEMLTLDAMEHAPTLWIVLTAREHLTRARCRVLLNDLRRRVRARWPGVEWFVQVEFQRRGALHLNLLVKGVPELEGPELFDAIAKRWCERVDAEPVGQWWGPIPEAEGLVRYLAKMLAHGLKVEQRPPIGWKGHRTSQTRGYLVRPALAMRDEARKSLRVKRRLRAALEALGDDAPAELVEMQAEHLRQVEEQTTWGLVQVRQLVGTDLLEVVRDLA